MKINRLRLVQGNNKRPWVLEDMTEHRLPTFKPFTKLTIAVVV